MLDILFYLGLKYLILQTLVTNKFYVSYVQC